MPEIEYPCPTCGTKLTAPADCAGAADRCPECEAFLRVPDRLPVVKPAPNPTLKLTAAEAKAAAGGLDLLRRSHWVSAAGWFFGLAAALGAVTGPAKGGPFAADAPLTKVAVAAMIVLLAAGAVLRAVGYVRCFPAARRVKDADLLVYAIAGAVLNAAAGVVYVIPWLVGPGYRSGPQPVVLVTVSVCLLLGRLADYIGLAVFGRLLVEFELPKTYRQLNELRNGSLLPALLAGRLLYGLVADARGGPSSRSSEPIGAPDDTIGLFMPVILFAATYVGIAAWQYGRVFARLRVAALESADLVR